ncbi:diguanylate cyclase [Caproiciproducens sp. NJN-50]|uniref:sensor domain-containing diguanylate cyclase n=1 Tax=Acutalibacteraceae TaxID=3082771 RepID=UPI000FFE1E63|nr:MULTISPECIES: sensor domain-containing diguanylate cyclase [Acutalibacteraceae]QAT50380.1 diguanylate cyclase [Caproiciproducens sp. NJN-50]
MKGKSFWFQILGFFLSAVTFACQTNGFQESRMTPGPLILSAAVSLCLLLIVWYRYVDKPTGDFLHTIHRAIGGDYGARFSCYAENDNFRRLSAAFNRLMGRVESQTEELTESRQLQSLLYENEKIYRSALELTCERVFEADLTHDQLIYGYETYQKVFSFHHIERFEDLIGKLADQAVHEEDAEKFRRTFDRRNLLETFNSSGVPEIVLEYRQRLPSGEVTWVSTSVIRSGDPENGLKVIGYVKNIDARKRKELEILKQSQKDGLTGIYNKRCTQSLIESFLAGSGNGGRHAAIMLDIDDFKRINDTLGHIQGDAALLNVAQRLSALFRSSDIVGRIGGDEFFVLMKDCGSREVLTEKLDALTGMFGEIHLEDPSFQVSGSIGVALYPEDGTDYRELYKKADVALYYSKAHGKNQYRIYSRQ